MGTLLISILRHLEYAQILWVVLGQHTNFVFAGSSHKRVTQNAKIEWVNLGPKLKIRFSRNTHAFCTMFENRV